MTQIADDWRDLKVEASGAKDLGPCPHCGNMTRRVWGYVSRDAGPLAAYFVEWTPGRSDHGALFDLIIGERSHDSMSNARWAASLQYGVVNGEGAFMVVDATSRPVAASGLAGEALRREEVIGTFRAPIVFAVADAVFAKEPRIHEIREWE